MGGSESTLRTPGNSVNFISLVGSDKLVAGGSGSSLATFDVASEAAVCKYNPASNVNFIYYDAGANQMYTCGPAKVQVWDISSPDPIHTFDLAYEALCVAADEKNIYSGGSNSHLTVWSKNFHDPNDAYTYTLEPKANVQYICTTKVRVFITGGTNSSLQVWSNDECELLQTLEPAANVNCIALSTCGNYVYTGQTNQTFQVWNLSSGQLTLQASEITEGDILFIAVSSPYFYAGGTSNKISVWKEGPRPELVTSLQTRTNLNCIAVSEDRIYTSGGQNWLQILSKNLQSSGIELTISEEAEKDRSC